MNEPEDSALSQKLKAQQEDWDRQARAQQPSSRADLYRIYAAWTGQLHHYVVRELGQHVDCEYFPDTYKFAVYSGHAEDAEIGGMFSTATVPGLQRPSGERKEIIQLPRPEDQPTQADLDAAFRGLCLAAARVLKINLGKPQLEAPEPEPKKHAFKRPRRIKQKTDESTDPRRRNLGAGKKED